VIVQGKYAEYRYHGGNVMVITTDTGYDAKQEVMYLSEASSNPLSVLRLILNWEKVNA
jgi:hypothetical protein